MNLKECVINKGLDFWNISIKKMCIQRSKKYDAVEVARLFYLIESTDIIDNLDKQLVAVVVYDSDGRPLTCEPRVYSKSDINEITIDAKDINYEHILQLDFCEIISCKIDEKQLLDKDGFALTYILMLMLDRYCYLI